MRPRTVAILVGILLMIVALVAWMSQSDEDEFDNAFWQPLLQQGNAASATASTQEAARRVAGSLRARLG
jgi:hypothetical protein